ncbi:MAG: ADP-forming succinate--CoA ligase subunit beta [Hyphomicrobiaceae bacterium]|nr:ADP-forming succinate--CoA ligase subunit beta [Hyphomicrobiaceae bacterium]
MNIHEYQAKDLMASYGLPTAKGIVAVSPEVARAAAQKIGGDLWVVKAQVHAGGRGKGGGVKIAKSPDEVRELASEIIGMQLVTHQTGPQGKKVSKIYVEEGSSIERELYLSLLVDRASSRISFIASTQGGMDIEKVAVDTPDKIISIDVDPASGISGFHGRQIAFALGLSGEAFKQCIKLVAGLYKLFLEKDAALIEINPLVVTGDGNLLILDAKMNFDDNALYRHKDIMELRDIDEEEPTEVEAASFDLNYVKLDGNIGCMVNGAGLAMGTMDIIKLEGAAPANFLDVGGGATKEQVFNAFKIILSDPNVEGILVNIFGGIMRCDIIAQGIVEAAKGMDIKVPLVVRLEGTNVALGKQILKDSGLAIIPADDLGDAAKKVVAAVKA